MTEVLIKIIEQLEEDIVFGRRRPRERLVEEDLVTQFNAKKHIIRQALNDLERMGLVKKIRNKGAMVRDYSPKDVRQIFSIRELLEAEAARHIPLPVDPNFLDALEDVFAKHDEAVDHGDLHQAFRTNIKFHQVLFSACGNPYLVEAIEKLALKAHAIRFYSLADPTLLHKARDDHRRMIDAIRSGDREALIEVCIEHLQPAKHAYISAHEKFIRPQLLNAE